MKLKHCVAATTSLFLLVQYELYRVSFPIISLSRDPGALGEFPEVQTPVFRHLLIKPWFGALILGLAVAALVGTIAGMRRHTGSKVGWTVVLAFAVTVVFLSASLAMVLPKFAASFGSLRIK